MGLTHLKPATRIFMEKPGLPEFRGPLYEHIVTQDRVFLRAQRRGLSFCVPLSVIVPPLIGLAASSCVATSLFLDCGLIPAAQLLGIQRQARTKPGESFKEYLIYLRRDGEGDDAYWYEPEQRRSRTSVAPVGEDRYCPGVLLELHTHPPECQSFSTVDDAEETGTRVYCMLEGVDSDQPKLFVRVGVAGQRVAVPASWVFELPPSWRDPISEALAEGGESHVGHE